MENILEVSNLAKNYDDFSLENVSFSLPYGSIMGLIGENGAGKTTIIKLILNAIHKDEGQIKIFGNDNISMEKYNKRFIRGYFNQCPFHEYLDAKSISKIMRRIYIDWNDNVYYNYLQKFNIPFEKRIKNYSTGMKVKLMMASVLATAPKLIILDEPTTGLDPIVRDSMLNIYKDYVKKENSSILFSSHIISDIEKAADFITFIHNGKIIFSTSKEDLLNSYVIIDGVEKDRINSKEHILAVKHINNSTQILMHKTHIPPDTDNSNVRDASIEDIMLIYSDTLG